MKRKAMALLLAAMMTATGSICVAETVDTSSPTAMGDQHYANVPGMPTQEAVLDDTITFDAGTADAQTCPVTVLEPDTLIVDTLTDIYDFVQEEQVMPVRYFPEDVQREVQRILKGVAIDVVDILHMTEFFGIRHDFTLAEGKAAQGCIRLEADYTVGQLVVVMYGDASQVDRQHLNAEEISRIEWTPLAAEVTSPGEITFQVPEDLLQRLDGQESLFLVLTDRVGGSGTVKTEELEIATESFIPSKDAGDMAGVYDTITRADGTPLPDDFRIFIRAHNEQTRNEIQRLQQFMQQSGQPIAAYFSEETQAQMALLLTEVQPESLICYNANFLGAEHYVDTYGDVIAGFRFATPYPEGAPVLCLLGTLKDLLPEQSADTVVPEESRYQWAVLRGEVKDGYVFITFPQQLIPVMEQDGALALFLSRAGTEESH